MTARPPGEIIAVISRALERLLCPQSETEGGRRFMRVEAIDCVRQVHERN